MNQESTERIARMKEAETAFERALSERAVSAMPVAVHHVASIERVEHYKRGDEYVFRFTRKVEGEGTTEQWEMLPRNAYAILDEFQKVKTPTDALDFLSNSGVFSPLDYTITWSEFQNWQRFAYLVQEHSQLASAMDQLLSDHSKKPKSVSSELQEVLKALSGASPSRFFDRPQKPESGLESKRRTDPEIGPMIQEGIAFEEGERRKLCAWFHEPPGDACSIHWIPKEGESIDDLTRKLQSCGAMIEFLLPREKLRPVFLIRTRYTLQAIAAAIYGDRIHGVEYRACEMCKALFRVGAHKEKKYCDRERCKNRAHQKNRRANVKEKNAGKENKQSRKGGLQ